MNKIINNVILVISCGLIGIIIFILIAKYSACKNYSEETEITFNLLICTNHLPDGKLETSQQSTGLDYATLIGIIAVAVYFRQSGADFISSLYLKHGSRNIIKESFFLWTGLFLYFLLFGFLAFFVSSFGFTVNLEALTSPLTVLGLFLFSAAISIPLGVSLYIGKKWLNSPTPKKIFYKMPLTTIIPSIAFAFLIWFYIIASLTTGGYHGGDQSGFLIILWPLYSVLYIVPIAIISLVFALYLYFYNKEENRKFFKPLAIVLAALPLLAITIGKTL